MIFICKQLKGPVAFSVVRRCQSATKGNHKAHDKGQHATCFVENNHGPTHMGHIHLLGCNQRKVEYSKNKSSDALDTPKTFFIAYQMTWPSRCQCECLQSRTGADGWSVAMVDFLGNNCQWFLSKWISWIGVALASTSILALADPGTHFSRQHPSPSPNPCQPRCESMWVFNVSFFLVREYKQLPMTHIPLQWNNVEEWPALSSRAIPSVH